MSADPARIRRFTIIIMAYPIALVLIGLAVNLLIFGVAPAVVALPAHGIVAALAVAAILLVIVHSWLMTSTELTRLHHGLHATPEEWAASDRDPEQIAPSAKQELDRSHNAHANLTENTAPFAVVVLPFVLISPSLLAAQVWIITFALGRLGHCYSYLSGRDGLRGIFMSLSLTALYGMMSYLLLSLFI